MNFRMIWLGPEDEPDGPLSGHEGRPKSTGDQTSVEYERTGGGMVRREPFRNGRVKLTPLANFSAKILRDIVYDDETEHRREFGVEAEMGGRRISFAVPAAEFSRMNWVMRELGPQAIIYPGQLQHARAAIQCLSTEVHREQIFTHLGWRKAGAEWVYLQAGGAVGSSGTLPDYQVRLPASLQHYRTYVPADHGALVRAVRSSLRLLSLAPDQVTLPLLAAVYRAPLGKANFSLFLTGRTGTFKTALASLCQQHFGAAMDSGCLPANFASTGNALEQLAFCAKDALMVVDDFVPIGGAGDSALHGVAERLFRAAGNHQGRSRMIGQTQLSPSWAPRAFILATGEEVPRGHSLRARLVILNLNPGDVDQGVLNESQAAGHEGLFASAMGAYLMWIAARYDELQQHLRARVSELRRLAHNRSISVHARLPTTLAELQSGWEVWLQFAVEVGAISGKDRNQLQLRAEKALDEVAAMQAPHHRSSDPALTFLTRLQAALAGGRAHVADQRGRVPDCPERWGWRRKRNGTAWFAQGTRIGWLTATELFLEPMASYEIVQQLAGSERLPVSAQTLRHRLRDHNLLASVDSGRQMLLVRRTLEGIPRQVLHLKAHDLVSISSKGSLP